jgi:hypothetical protein
MPTIFRRRFCCYLNGYAVERAVFLLHESFGFSYADDRAVIGQSETAFVGRSRAVPANSSYERPVRACRSVYAHDLLLTLTLSARDTATAMYRTGCAAAQDAVLYTMARR